MNVNYLYYQMAYKDTGDTTRVENLEKIKI